MPPGGVKVITEISFDVPGGGGWGDRWVGLGGVAAVAHALCRCLAPRLVLKVSQTAAGLDPKAAMEPSRLVLKASLLLGLAHPSDVLTASSCAF